MKIIPIILKEKSGHDCFDTLIAAICNWKKIDYSMMFCESWGFMYKSNKDNTFIISNNLSTDRGDELYYLKKYHGVDLKKIDINEIEIVSFISQEILNNSPVLLKVDTFYCPWMFDDYKIKHTNHYVIVNGYDEKTNDFYSIDNQYAINGAEFPKNDLINALKEAYRIRFEYKINNINTKDVLCKAVDRLCDKNGDFLVGKRIETFAEDLVNYMNLDEEVKSCRNSPSTALLFQLIDQIGGSRYKFSLALDYIEKTNKDFQLDNIIKMLQDVSIKWQEALAMLIKAYFLKNRYKMYKRIYSKIIDIKNFEEDIVINIKRLIMLQDNHINSIEILDKNMEIEFNPVNYKFVDISDYLNCNGIYKEETIYCNAELSNPNRYFVPKFKIENDEINVDKFKFKINNFMNDKFDNIICEGQEIKLNIDRYNKIMILACSEFGDFDEKIEIHYDNNEKEIINFKTSTWLSTIEREKNQLALLGRAVVRYKEKVNIYPFDVSLYASYFNLNHQKNIIRKIKLPDCINIHVFAITFAE